MKNVKFFFAAMALMAASCTNETLDSSVNLSSEQAVAPVTVRVSDFSVEQGAFPMKRAQAVGEYNVVNYLTLAFYKSDGTEQYKVTHQKSNMGEGETFGEFSTSLPIGSYTMVVIGNAGNSAVTLTSATSANYGENSVRETFLATQAVNVTNSSALELTATLDRIVTAVSVQSTDNRPTEVVKVRITTSTGAGEFNPTTGFATSNDGVVSEIVPTTAVGSPTFNGTYLFLAADQQTANVTIETLDANNQVLFSKTVNNVSLKRNRQTRLTGAIYTNNSVSAGSFQVNADWLNNHNMDL